MYNLVMILLITYKAKPGMREKFVEEVVSRGLLERIRKDEGCIYYRYYYDADDCDKLLLVEEWTEEECQKKHMEMSHTKELLSIKDEYIDESSVKKLG